MASPPVARSRTITTYTDSRACRGRVLDVAKVSEADHRHIDPRLLVARERAQQAALDRDGEVGAGRLVRGERLREPVLGAAHRLVEARRLLRDQRRHLAREGGVLLNGAEAGATVGGGGWHLAADDSAASRGGDRQQLLPSGARYEGDAWTGDAATGEGVGSGGGRSGCGADSEQAEHTMAACVVKQAPGSCTR